MHIHVYICLSQLRLAVCLALPWISHVAETYEHTKGKSFKYIVALPCISHDYRYIEALIVYTYAYKYIFTHIYT